MSPRALACLCLTLFAAPAFAESQNPYLSAGIRLYSDFEYENALEQFKKAASFPGNLPADDVQISIYSGLTKFELGDRNGAESDFKNALALDPDVQLPGKVSPKVAASFQKARAEILKARPPKTQVAKTKPPPVDPVKQTDPKKTIEVRVQQDPVRVNTGHVETPRVTDQSRYTVASPVGGLEPSNTVSGTYEKPSKSKVLPMMLLGLAVAVGGGGGYFGLQSSGSVDSAKAAEFQSDGARYMDTARSQALTANVMYGAAAIAATAGVITLIASLSE